MLKKVVTKIRAIKKYQLVLVGLTVVLLAFFNIKAYIERPQDLGPELEYIGKSDYGCYFFCDASPGSVYYFATDLTQEELELYFTKATYVDYPNVGGGGGAHYNFDFLFLRPFGSEEEFVFSYYDNSQAVIDVNHLKQTNKQYIISISGFHFMRAQASL